MVYLSIKEELGVDDVDALAAIFKILADPTRLRLIRLLNAQPEMACQCHGQKFLCVNALAGQLGVSQSAVSQHLRILRQADLVSAERRGSFVHYTLNDETFQKYQQALQQMWEVN